MRTLTRILLASSGAALAVLSATPAVAQPAKDVSPNLPNVLLLIDNSGSMEYLIDPAGKLPGDKSAALSVCDGKTTNLLATNRWTNLVTALTGSIAPADFTCLALDRHSAAFQTEYGEPGVAPYDANYYLPFNRIYSNNCAYGAGTLAADNTWDWWNLPSADGIHKDYQWRDGSGAVQASCTFKQTGDGILDAFSGLVRFGMMTLDTFPNPGTGSNVTATPASALGDYKSAEKGMWSYYHNWLSVAAPAVAAATPQPPPTPIGGPGGGNPALCATPSYFEVGARNQAAPPWEGRLVPFGDWNSDAKVPATNLQIQQELLSLRPYGATPVAAMLDDAREFLFGDTTQVPGQSYNFGPTDDQYWEGGCRKTFVILMSDGMDNMDLRAHTLSKSVGGVATYNGCDTAGSPAGACPYAPADQIAQQLQTGVPPNQSVFTYVVGFTVSDISKLAPVPAPASGAKTCDVLTLGVGSDCDNPAPQLKACCELNKIAFAGGTHHAYFADNAASIRPVLAGILSQIVQGTTDRTSPSYAPGGVPAGQGKLATTQSASYQFTASFSVSPNSAGGGLWTGNLYRERYACIGGVPTPQDPTLDQNRALGDDFAYNVEFADGKLPRNFFTVIATDVNAGGHGHGGDHVINSDYTIRPFVPLDDGFGVYKPDPDAPSTPEAGSGFPGDMGKYPAAFLVADKPCDDNFADKDPANCTQDLVTWEIGAPVSLPPKATFHTRNYQQCPGPIACKGPLGCPCRAFGAIFHSTPVAAGPPREFLRDDSYTAYANTPAVAAQETMLYTATMDGQLHAFKVQAGNGKPPDNLFVDQGAINNERWSFFPARVLQHLLPNYDSAVPLLDGVPVIADVPGTVYDISAVAAVPVLEQSGTNTVGWHRVLVSGGGGAVTGGFYYALEITDPEKPRFLWQMSTDAIGTPIFGSTTPTPAIAIVNVSPTSGATPIHLPIAILPGGATGATIDACDPTLTTDPAVACVPGSPVMGCTNVLPGDISNQHLLSVTASPSPLRCWDMSKAGNVNHSSGNSLTIVRLDTGKVLAHFVGMDYAGAPHNVGGGDHGGDNGHGGDNNGDKEKANANVYDAPFRAPLSGIPVPYPGLTGGVSDRVYVGDADGLLWRLDFSDPNIDHWAANISLAWDAYIDDPTAKREGLAVPPIITRDPIGNPIILIATGDQDTFSVQPSSNHVWSLTENPGTLKVSANWHLKMPPSGARVTGPMALFNGALYFASFQPKNVNVCSDGYASVWAVDYLRQATSVSAVGVPAGMSPLLNVWPAPAYPTAKVGSFIYGTDAAPGTIIEGVSVSQTPTCESTTASQDPYFGSHTAVSGSNSSFQVSWQVGGGKGITGAPVSGVGSQSLTPPAPGRGTRIDSWASVVE